LIATALLLAAGYPFRYLPCLQFYRLLQVHSIPVSPTGRAAETQRWSRNTAAVQMGNDGRAGTVDHVSSGLKVVVG